MKTSRTTITTQEGSAYIRKLCKHFAHKIKTSYTETEGRAEFPFGEGCMFANDKTLRFDITADSFENLARIKYVIVTHLEKFAFREDLKIVWEDNEPAPEPDWGEMGRQLSNPTGEQGKKVGVSMNYANMGMIMRAFEQADLKSGQHLLELGPGNGAHVKEVLTRWPGVSYTGGEISETMILEAAEQCGEMLDVSFLLIDGRSLPFADEAFDRIVTVNTLYFWKNPTEYAKEIRRVLKKDDGLFCLAFIEKGFMKNLPFTQYGFELYDEEKVKGLLETAGFEVTDIVRETEEIRSNTGEKIERDRVLVLAK